MDVSSGPPSSRLTYTSWGPSLTYTSGGWGRAHSSIFNGFRQALTLVLAKNEGRGSIGMLVRVTGFLMPLFPPVFSWPVGRTVMDIPSVAYLVCLKGAGG